MNLRRLAICTKAVALLQKTPDNQSNVGQRRLRVIACTELGNTYASLAANTKPKSLAAKDWRAAVEMYRHGLDIMHELRDRGILDADDLMQMEEIERKAAQCNSSL